VSTAPPAAEAVVAAVVDAVGEGAEPGDAFGVPLVDVPSASWPAALTAARDAGCVFFDWLSAVDEGEEGFSVVAHVASVPLSTHLLVRTRVPRESPRLPSATGVFRGASWHERETHEMFDIGFDGHPNLVPLLLPEAFEGHPLRKEFVLAARAAKPWPGAKEPGESEGEGGASPSRRRTRPPGVPDPETWGPRPPE
jgi:NADH-quinone oxidoreductase subunit C